MPPVCQHFAKCWEYKNKLYPGTRSLSWRIFQCERRKLVQTYKCTQCYRWCDNSSRFYRSKKGDWPTGMARIGKYKETKHKQISTKKWYLSWRWGGNWMFHRQTRGQEWTHRKRNQHWQRYRHEILCGWSKGACRQRLKRGQDCTPCGDYRRGGHGIWEWQGIQRLSCGLTPPFWPWNHQMMLIGGVCIWTASSYSSSEMSGSLISPFFKAMRDPISSEHFSSVFFLFLLWNLITHAIYFMHLFCP